MTIATKSALFVPSANRAAHVIGEGNFTATVKLPAGSIEGAISIVEHTLRPHTLAAPLHRHSNEDEITHVLAGELTVLQMDEIFIVKAGEYITKPRGLWHTFWNAGSEDAHLMEVITPGGFEAYFAELEALIPKAGMPDMGALLVLGARYGLEFNLNSIPELLGKYQLRL